MARLTAEQSKQARQIARSERAEEGWLGSPQLLQAWPARTHAALGSIRAVPSEVKVLESSIPSNEIDSRVLASDAHQESDPFGNANENANIKRAIGKDHVRTRGLRDYHFPDNEISGRSLRSSANDDNGRAINIDHCRASLRNPAQGAPGLRSISDLLGGARVTVAAGDHSHGSGNTMDLDYLPDEERRRFLAQSLLLRRGKRAASEASDVTRQEFETMRSVLLTLVHILRDAPDLDGFERERLRRRGELPFEKAMFEWRRGEEAEEAGEYIHHRKLKNYATPHPDLVA